MNPGSSQLGAGTPVDPFQDFEPDEFDPTNAPKLLLDHHINNRIQAYTVHNWMNYNLWEAFQDDFSRYKAPLFNKASKDVIRQLRDLLRQRGVLIRSQRGLTIANALDEAVHEPEPALWSDLDIQAQIALNSTHLNDAIASPTDTTGIPQNLNSTPPQLRSPLTSLSGTARPITNLHSVEPQSSSPPQISPPVATSTTPNYGREIANVVKMYTEESKYSGDDDHFTFKLTIFHDICRRSALPEEAKALALPTMLKGQALDFYYANTVATLPTFKEACASIQGNFEGPEYGRQIQEQWNTISLPSVIKEEENTGKSTTACLDILLNKLRHLQHGLDPSFRSDAYIHNKLISACRGIPACKLACFKPSPTISGLLNDLRASIKTWEAGDHTTTHAYFTDRRYMRSNAPDRRQGRIPSKTRKCYVCGGTSCISTDHPIKEQEEAKARYKKRFDRYKGTPTSPRRFNTAFRQYVASIEQPDSDYDSDYDIAELIDLETFLADIEITDSNDADGRNSEHFMTSFGLITPNHAIKISHQLANDSFNHLLTGSIIPDEHDPFVYAVTANRYNATIFHGVMIDTGASQKSTAGYNQFLAYQKLHDAELDATTKGSVSVQFGIGSCNSMGSLHLQTPAGQVEFHIVDVDTPFLLCLADMDRLHIYYNNMTNTLVAGKSEYPVIRRFGHAFWIWNTLPTYATRSYLTEACYLTEPCYLTCYLTEPELRQLHRRFGHPSVARLQAVLERSDHDFEIEILQRIAKFCKFCQKHSRSPGRFKFSLRDDESEFNYAILVDVMYIAGEPVLHIIDEATSFQAGSWLQNMTTKHIWDTIRACWIDTYLGPPELITYDAGKSFASKDFQHLAAMLGVSTKEVPVEAHWSIGKVERYHAMIRRAYQIVQGEMPDLPKQAALQMALKAVNDTAGPNGIVPTLLVFGAFPRMSALDPPTASIAQRSAAAKKAMNEIRHLKAKRQVDDALNQRNGPNTMAIHDLPLNSEVITWREGKGGKGGEWKGPYKLLELNGETCVIDTPHGPTSLRSTVVKPYYSGEDTSIDLYTDPLQSNDNHGIMTHQRFNRPGRGNQDHNHNTPLPHEGHTIHVQPPPKRPRGRPRKNATIAYLQDDASQFTASRQKELNGLIDKGVFKVIPIAHVPTGIRIFNSRFVDEIKHQGTSAAFEKSRLVVQAYNDHGKELVLTQSPTIQRASQRLILAITAMMPQFQLYLRDISQAYVQSTTTLNRKFFIRPPPEFQLLHGQILQIVKPLYGVPEAGNHWFKTYHNHHVEQLHTTQSSYDPCLLYTPQNQATDLFGVVGLQTDDTLFLANEAFASLEQEKLQFEAKDRDILSPDQPIKFNGGLITKHHDPATSTYPYLIFNQEKQCAKLTPIQLKPADSTSSRGITRKALSTKDQYIAQRARGAYIATVCQPEAAFDLSFAAQCTDPHDTEIKALNKRIEWQIDNPTRGLRYVHLDQKTLKLVVFTDASFANNIDLSSQIGYIITLADASNKANILHWSSIKCKRVTRSVLASELYAMAHGFDIAGAIKSTIEAILNAPIPLVLCTDSKSLYDCLVKLGTTMEKRLMIDLMCLRQAYERREIAEIKWIAGGTNPADAMTKSKACDALTLLIDTNTVNIQATEWVERA